MLTQTQAAHPTYQTITGGHILLSGLREAEFDLLDRVAQKYDAQQDWTRFAAWWNAEFNSSGLPTASAVYRICQDLETRLGIGQGKVAPPDYRDYLTELIDARFHSRQDFCRASGIDPGQLSRVLAGRDNLSMPVLNKALEVLQARLVLQTEQDSQSQTGVARAVEAIADILKTRQTQTSTTFAKGVGPLSVDDSATGTTELLGADWKESFPHVRNIDQVRADAKYVAEHQMPLMIPV